MRAMLKSDNLIPFPYTKGNTMAGVNISVNPNGSVTLKGETTSEAYFSLYGSWSARIPIKNLFEAGKTYTISDNGTNVRALIFIFGNSTRNFSNTSFTVLDSDREFIIFIYVGGAKTIDETIYPMLNEGSVALPYQPYFCEYQGIGRSKNLVNEDILVEYGAEKLASGEYYFKYASTPYKKVIWENTENYQGFVFVCYDVSYVQTTTAVDTGVTFNIYYTDGTNSGWQNQISVNTGYHRAVAISKAGKIVSHVQCDYGTGTCQTYLKNIMLNYGDTALPYQPYLQRYDMYMYDNLVWQKPLEFKREGSNTYTYDGITWTYDENTGWVTANGTATDTSYVQTATSIVPRGKYILKGISGGGYSTYRIRINTDGIAGYTKDFYNDTIFSLDKDIAYRFLLIVSNGATANNLVFKPELIRLIGD